MTSDTGTGIRSGDLGKALRDLSAGINQACDAIAQDGQQGIPVYMVDRKLNESSHFAALALRDIDHMGDQDGRTSQSHPGLVGACEETLQWIAQINFHKRHARSVYQSLRAQLSQQYRPPRLESELRLRLTHLGYPRLNLKKLERETRILPAIPDHVGWFWAHTAKTKRLNQSQAEQLLRKYGDDFAITQQLEWLHSLPDGEMLAQVRPPAWHLRANISFRREPENQRYQLPACLPFFFPAHPGSRLPAISLTTAHPPTDTARPPRGGRKLQEQPFLPAIHAHRYLRNL